MDDASRGDAGLTGRQNEIVSIVGEQGFATIDTLARHFDVSAQSIRRDIIRLDAAGMLQRFHGGAGVREPTVRMAYAEKRVTASDAKERIGVVAAEMIAEGSCVFLDVGTTAEAVARALRRKQRLRVFTVSLPSASILTGRPGIDLFVLGGSVHGPDGSMAGESTIAAIGRFRFDHAVIGYSGFDEDGAPMDFDLEKVAVKRHAIARSANVLAVGDASKFARTAVARIAPPEAIDAIVTDILGSGQRKRFVETLGYDVRYPAKAAAT